MGLRVNNNVQGLNAQRQIGAANQALRKNLEGLAAGLRINRAADDAAGLAIAERFRTQVRQYTQEVNNLQMGVNAVQTAEGGLGTQQEAVGRIRELAVQAANGTLTDDQRAALNQEAQQLMEQIGNVAQNTQFNGRNLLDGTAANLELGTEGGIRVNFQAATVEALGLNGVNLATQGGATTALEQINTAINRLDQNRANLGAQENRLTRAIETRETATTNITESESRIRDLDIARAAMERTRNETMLQGGLYALIQGNVIPQAAAQLLGTR